MIRMHNDLRMMENVAKNLRSLIEDRGWAQADLARASGLTENVISGILRKKNVPNVVAMVRIAEALRTTVDYLVRDHKKEFSPSS